MSTHREKVSWSVVHRPSDMGIDLPAGASANKLVTTDYHVVDMEEGIEDQPAWKREQRAIRSGHRRS